MTLTIELSPDQEARLAEAARSQGVAPTELARRLVTEHLPAPDSDGEPVHGHQPDRSHFYFTATPEEWEAAMDELADMNKDLPVLPDEAFDRENLYDERL